MPRNLKHGFLTPKLKYQIDHLDEYDSHYQGYLKYQIECKIMRAIDELNWLIDNDMSLENSRLSFIMKLDLWKKINI